MRIPRTYSLAIAGLGCLLAGLALVATSSANSAAKNVTFTKDVAPIFFESCAECHRAGEAAPMSLLSYQEARPWAKSIREKVAKKEMPPWHADPHYGEFVNDRRLTQKEIETIIAWVDGGAKEGNPKDLPPAPRFVDGWTIGQPDKVIYMPEEFTLEATGPDEYQYFEVDPGFKEDVYVQAAEARPGNRKIVHHIIAFVQPPPRAGQARPNLTKEEIEKLRAEREKNSIVYRDGFLMRTKADAPVYDDGCAMPGGGTGSRRDGGGGDGGENFLVGFAPGNIPAPWEPGTVKKIAAGSKIVFQMHYSKTAGSVQKDRSMIGLIFAKQPGDKLVVTRGIANNYFKIPPGAERHKVTACWTPKQDIRLTSAIPHMHVRGTSMEYKVIYPDGRSEVILNVPDYSFSWQTTYTFKKPIPIPKGSQFFVTAYFDNSAKNKYNPDPTQAVRFGEPTYDEMMIGFIEYTVPSPQMKPAAAATGGNPAQQKN
jgi:mono/diheme cytochrome c family protein